MAALLQVGPGHNSPLAFSADVGDLILLEGPNGSGKSSLLRAIAGLPAPGLDSRITILVAEKLVGTGHTPQQVQLALQDPRDNLVGLTVAGEFRLRNRPLPPNLAGLADRDVATLSSGETRQVSLAVAWPKQKGTLLLLDEPCEGLGESGRKELLELVTQSRRTGAVVAVDHSGILAQEAGPVTRVVRLGQDPEPKDTLLPKIEGGPVLESPPTKARRTTSLSAGAKATSLVLPALSLGPGLHCLTGENGIGKSTLLLHLAGLLEGAVPMAEKSVRIMAAPPSPGENVRLLLPRARDLLTHPTVEMELKGIDADVALAFVATGLHNRHPLTLSGGEAQRVALAKALGRKSPVYLLDEPEAYLDAAGWQALLDTLRQRLLDGACILVATHDRRLQGLAHTTLALEAP